jgi:hypothetical protein
MRTPFLRSVPSRRNAKPNPEALLSIRRCPLPEVTLTLPSKTAWPPVIVTATRTLKLAQSIHQLPLTLMGGLDAGMSQGCEADHRDQGPRLGGEPMEPTSSINSWIAAPPGPEQPGMFCSLATVKGLAAQATETGTVL